MGVVRLLAAAGDCEDVLKEVTDLLNVCSGDGWGKAVSVPLLTGRLSKDAGGDV